jgi:hypothetical protein
MELKVTHIEGIVPQGTVNVTPYSGSYDETDGEARFECNDESVNNAVYLFGFFDQFPVTNDTVFDVTLAEIIHNGVLYHIRHSAQPSISINGNEVTLTYTDCLLPLNGTNGTIIVKFINQL